MSEWPQTPSWVSPSEINAGKQFAPADGLRANDLNRLVENLLYLKKFGTASQIKVEQTTGPSTQDTISQKALTDLLYPFGSVVPQHKEGTVVRITDEIVGDKIEVAIDPEAGASNWRLYKTNSNMFVPNSKMAENQWYSTDGIEYTFTDSGVFTIDANGATKDTWVYLSRYQDDGFVKAGHYMISLNMGYNLPSGWEAQFAAYVVDPTSGERKYKHSFTWKGAQATKGVGKYFAEDCYLQLRILVKTSNRSRVVISPQVNLGYELLPWEKPSRGIHIVAGNAFEISTTKPSFTDFYMFATTSGDIEVDYQINMYSMLDTLKILQDVLTYLDNKVPTFYVHNAHIDAVNGAASAYAVEQFTADFTYYWPSIDAIEPTLAGFHDFVLNYQAGGLLCVGVAVVSGQTYLGNWVAADDNYLYFRSGTNQIAIAADDPDWDLTLSTDKFIKLT